jgi:hypothetical protein
MYETSEDVTRLDSLIRLSIDKATWFHRASFEMPHKTMFAADLIDYWTKGHSCALATVTRRCEPRVSPVSAVLYRGHLYVPTSSHSMRAGNLRNNAAVSLSHHHAGIIALVVHGRAVVAKEWGLKPRCGLMQWSMTIGGEVCANAERACSFASMLTASSAGIESRSVFDFGALRLALVPRSPAGTPGRSNQFGPIGTRCPGGQAPGP